MKPWEKRQAAEQEKKLKPWEKRQAAKAAEPLKPWEKRQAAERDADGIDLSSDIPVVTDMDAYADSHKAVLQKEQMQAEADARAAQAEVDFLERPLHEQALATAADAASVAADIPKLLLDSPSIIARDVFGAEDVRNVTDIMGIPRGMHHTPEGSVARAGAEMVGNTAAVGTGFIPVNRMASKASSVTADILGLGNSTESAASMAIRTGMQELPEGMRVMPQAERTAPNWNNADQVDEILQDASDQAVAVLHRPEFAKLDKIEFDYDLAKAEIDELAKRGDYGSDPVKVNERKAKELRKAQKDYDKAVAEVEAGARGTQQGDFGGVINFGEEYEEAAIRHMARRFDMPLEEVQGIIVRQGGLRKQDELGHNINGTLTGIRERVYAGRNKEMYTTTGKPKTGAADDYQWGSIQEWVRPATALLRENVGKGFSSLVERAYVKATADKSALVNKYQGRAVEFKEIVEWAENPAIKRKFMDLQYTGVAGRSELLQLARREMNQDSYEMFTEFVEDSFKHQQLMKKKVFSPDAKLDEIHWGIATRPDADPTALEEMVRMGQGKADLGGDPNSVAAMSRRERLHASSMSEAHLATYDNPILSQFTRLSQDQDILRLHETLGMGPSLKEVSKLADVNASIVRHVKAVTGNEQKAVAAGKIMEDILQGSRKTPPQSQRIFMSQAYAGTLGQVDSALLNAHDIFTSAWRQGPVATAKAVMDFFDSTRMTADEFGISDAHLGEFREGIGHAFNGSPTKMDWVEKKVNGYSDFAFTWSGFKALDLAGKGVVMRATLYDMQSLVNKKNGMQKLRTKYGHLISDRQLGEVARFLKSGADIRTASPRQLDILGSAMLGRLAEQQLISMASRPLRYLQQESWRPMWAMSGFAIRQADLLKVEVLDRVKAGDYEGAGTAAALWFGWSVTGYVITDTMRDAATYAISGKDSKDPRNVGTRYYEGVAGPLTMNKLGDPYSTEQFSQDPVGYALQSVLPPSGAVGSAFRAGAAAVQGDDPMADVFEALPSIGRQLKYFYEAQDQGRPKRSRGPQRPKRDR